MYLSIQTYTVEFSNYLVSGSDNFDRIQITAKPAVLHTIAYSCYLSDDDCALDHMRRMIPEMIIRNSNIFGVVRDRSKITSLSKSSQTLEQK